MRNPLTTRRKRGDRPAPAGEGQKLALKKLTADQKFTQPPPLYTEATLIHALEENGIGRPSTYAPIITTIVDRGYVEKDQKKLKTTPLGQAVNTVMMEQFPDIVNVKFSADMEKKLDVVEAGEADWVKTIDESSIRALRRAWSRPRKNMEGKRIKVEDIPTDEICESAAAPWSSSRAATASLWPAPASRSAATPTRSSRIRAVSARWTAATCWCAKAARAASTTAAATTPSAII